MSEGEPRIVGRVPFVDSVTRDVYEDADSRQWVVGYDGERVYGVWVTPADEPVMVAGGGARGWPRCPEPTRDAPPAGRGYRGVGVLYGRRVAGRASAVAPLARPPCDASSLGRQAVASAGRVYPIVARLQAGSGCGRWARRDGRLGERLRRGHFYQIAHPPLVSFGSIGGTPAGGIA
jgi:hypothetical protein